MQGRITIELTREQAPNSGSALPDMAHVAYDLKKLIEAYEVPGPDGRIWKLADSWTVTSIGAQSSGAANTAP